MEKRIISEIKEVILASVGHHLDLKELTDDYELLGNLLDSISITNLIIALEEQFGIIFNEDELLAEDFETVISLSELVERKLKA